MAMSQTVELLLTLESSKVRNLKLQGQLECEWKMNGEGIYRCGTCGPTQRNLKHIHTVWWPTVPDQRDPPPPKDVVPSVVPADDCIPVVVNCTEPAGLQAASGSCAAWTRLALSLEEARLQWKSRVVKRYPWSSISCAHMATKAENQK